MLSKIIQKIDEIMDDDEKKININKVKWKKYDEITKFSLDVDDICYYIDSGNRDIYYKMKQYVNLRKKHNINPLKYPIIRNLYKIYIVSDGKKASYHYTKESVSRALKNSLHGYFNKQINNRLNNFTGKTKPSGSLWPT